MKPKKDKIKNTNKKMKKRDEEILKKEKEKKY